MDDYVMVKSYDGKVVRVPLEKKEEYLKNQKRILMLLDEGKDIQETLNLLRCCNDK